MFLLLLLVLFFEGRERDEYKRTSAEFLLFCSEHEQFLQQSRLLHNSCIVITPLD